MSHPFSRGPAPSHLLAFPWYLPHQAWLKSMDLSHHETESASSRADLSDADLSDAVLRGADLRGADLRGAVLRGADLSDADLSDADLSDAVIRGAVLRGAVLRGADLRGAVLRGADLRGADLRGAVLSRADDTVPVIPEIHKAVYGAACQPGALNMSQWHSCGTTHCRAGWVVALAGEEGRKLEAAYSTPYAATLIYLASDPNIERIPDFYCDNTTALEDMKRLADAS